MSGKGIFSRVRNVWKTLTKKSDSPRESQERSELFKIALASTYRKLRMNAASQGRKASDLKLPREQLGSLFDEASTILEEKVEAYDLPIRSLRLEVQKIIAPQVVEILKACRDIEYEDLSELNMELEEQNEIENEEVVEFCKRHLLKECYHVLEQTENIKMMGNGNGNGNANTNSSEARQQLYLGQRLSALQTIASFYGWEETEIHNQVTSKDGGDAFGYYINADEEINKAIRYYQMMNLTKALLVRQNIGYAPLALQSTIPKAGRGVFVDGFAPAGSVISFFPGDVWPKEYLTNIDAVAKVFKNDPKHQLSIRYDDILIDSRSSPYTVLDNDNSNLFALGHIVNHPPKSTSNGEGEGDVDGDSDSGINCTTSIIDFSKEMELGKNKLRKFIPNTYHKPPMTFGVKAIDLQEVQMHGFGLIASRDIENEELFFDYRLSPGDGKDEDSQPDWYHVCDTDEHRRRWSRD